jgi:hypothetical protein
MFNTDIYAKHHRGSSPPSQNPMTRLEDWMRSCRSIDQHPYDLSDIEMLRQCVVPKIEFHNTKFGDEHTPEEVSSIKE